MSDLRLDDLKRMEARDTALGFIEWKHHPVTASEVASVLSDAGYRVFTKEEIAKWTYCPVCGNWAGDHNEPKPEGLVWCSPGRCPAWQTVAKFNHASRKWEPVGRSKP